MGGEKRGFPEKEGRMRHLDCKDKSINFRGGGEGKILPHSKGGSFSREREKKELHIREGKKDSFNILKALLLLGKRGGGRRNI